MQRLLGKMDMCALFMWKVYNSGKVGNQAFISARIRQAGRTEKARYVDALY